MLKKFLRDEEGMGTVELVLIIAALIAVAVIFRKYVVAFVTNQMSGIFSNEDLTKPADTNVDVSNVGKITTP